MTAGDEGAGDEGAAGGGSAPRGRRDPAAPEVPPGAPGVAAAVEAALTRWPGVTAGPHAFGAREFRIGRRELGHLHDDRVADLPFPRAVRDALVAAGRAERHHWAPESGWVSVPIRGPGDVPALLALFRLSYERPWLAAPAGPDGRGGSGRP